MNRSKQLNILFISRAYPPVIGGIEKQNYEISQALGQLANVKIIVNRRGKKFLPIFLIYAFFKALTSLHKSDVILLGDGVLAILGFMLKGITNKPVICILHGLDITFSYFLYQRFWVKLFIPALDKWIAVGNETISQGKLRGLNESKFIFIGNGVFAAIEASHFQRADLHSIIGFPVTEKVILTLGRLVKRKGVEWFVKEVMPLLSDDITYIIAGEGNEREHIAQAILDHGLQQRVICLGPVSDHQKNILLKTVNLFIQPNIPIEGDMEGFGLVVLEAAVAGCIVVASRIEGLKDAIHDGKNGILLPPQDALAYHETITRLLQDPEAMRAVGRQSSFYTRSHFSWDRVAQSYLTVLNQLVTLAKTQR